MNWTRFAIIILVSGLSTTGNALAEPVYSLGLRLSQWSPHAGDTFEILFDEPLLQPGVDFEVGFAERWWTRILVERTEESGTTVEIGPQGQLIRTGSPTEIELMPIHLSAGWRSGSVWDVYLGGGPSLLSWKTRDFLGSQSESETGFHALVGVRRALGNAGIGLGLEVLYSSFGDAIGEGGVSALVGEDDLGGLELSLAARWTFGR